MYNSQNSNDYDPWGSYGYDNNDPTSYDYTYYKGKKGGAQVNPARAIHSSGPIGCHVVPYLYRSFSAKEPYN